jgi:ubiquinone biosynthesis protein UbiJ
MSAAPSLLCAGMEIALNRFLALEADVLAECGTLTGRAIRLSIDPPPLGDFFIEFHGGGVRVSGTRESEADVALIGSLPLVARLGWQASHGESGLPQGLTVEGDTELLTRFNRMLARVGFDPEEFGAKLVGDAAAHRIRQGLGGLLAFGRDTARTLGLDTAEYLREETKDLARGVDVEEWMNEVDGLRDAVERFEARLARLAPP